MLGKKVKGFWGAMYPWSYGVITKVEGFEVEIDWDDDDEPGLDNYVMKARDIMTEYPESGSSIGVYFDNDN